MEPCWLSSSKEAVPAFCSPARLWREVAAPADTGCESRRQTKVTTLLCSTGSEGTIPERVFVERSGELRMARTRRSSCSVDAKNVGLVAVKRERLAMIGDVLALRFELSKRRVRLRKGPPRAILQVTY
jgi:hypothetical protein